MLLLRSAIACLVVAKEMASSELKMLSANFSEMKGNVLKNIIAKKIESIELCLSRKMEMCVRYTSRLHVSSFKAKCNLV